ncbi:MAG: hypothetical protein PUD79_02475 [Prevotellaceae bacterium]|nr:hypothetical protein [Prevotellaceae bacterium]
MKTKLLSLMLIALIATPQLMANPTQNQSQSEPPTNVINAIKDIASKQYTTNSINTTEDPETNKITNRVEIYEVNFNENDTEYKNLIEAFEKDKECGYTYFHLLPKEGGVRNAYIGNNENEKIIIRKNIDQEFYMIVQKNPNDPTLRDLYSVTIENKYFYDQWGRAKNRKLTIHVITSLRPDLFGKDLNTLPGEEYDLNNLTDEGKRILKSTVLSYKQKFNLLEDRIRIYNNILKTGPGFSKMNIYNKEIDKEQKKLDKLRNKMIKDIEKIYKKYHK